MAAVAALITFESQAVDEATVMAIAAGASESIPSGRRAFSRVVSHCNPGPESQWISTS